MGNTSNTDTSIDTNSNVIGLVGTSLEGIADLAHDAWVHVQFDFANSIGMWDNKEKVYVIDGRKWRWDGNDWYEVITGETGLKKKNPKHLRLVKSDKRDIEL